MPNIYMKMLFRLIYQPLFKRFDELVFVSKNQKKYWSQKYGVQLARSRVIYNGINVDTFKDKFSVEEKQKLRNSLGIGSRDVVVGICAGLKPVKRHKDLVDAVKLLREKQLQVKLLIIGDGEERSSVEKRIKENSIGEHVIITGYQEDVKPYIAISDIMAFVSMSEAFSIAILEAMAMGKFLVASDVGGVSEQVMHGKNGFLFKSGDVCDLSAKIEKAISDGMAKSMGEKSLGMVRARFTTEKMVQKYKELLIAG